MQAISQEFVLPIEPLISDLAKLCSKNKIKNEQNFKKKRTFVKSNIAFLQLLGRNHYPEKSWRFITLVILDLTE